ncbi:uncharacterized protein V6R79_009438 [Siganus canaliculatus]
MTSTTETLGHTGAATTPLQAVDDAASRPVGVSLQFGSSSHTRAAPWLHSQGSTVPTHVCANGSAKGKTRSWDESG